MAVAEAVRLARIVYPDEAPPDYGPDVDVIQRRHARAIVVQEPGRQVVAFGGSDDVHDWLGNVRVFRVQRTHVGGIYDGVADYYDILREQLRDALIPGKPTCATGHSLGGACAIRFAVGYAARGGVVEDVQTFGSPMVGGRDFADIAAATGVAGRVTNWWIAGDLIPYQPTSFGFSLGYRRVGRLRVLHRDGTETHTTPSWWASKPWKTWAENKRICHAIRHYHARLAA